MGQHLIDWKLLRNLKGCLVLTPRASDINQNVRRALGCLHLLEPQEIGWQRSLLTDGGVKFFLQVQEVERLVSGNR